jgi:polysaccharide pyruvyl transferase WcaK-like protein
MSVRKKIFIDGASFAHKSRGNQAMAISAFLLFRKAFPSADLVILSSNPALDFNECKKRGFEVSINHRSNSPLKSLLSFFKQCRNSDMIAGLYGDGFTWKRDLHCFNLISQLYLDLIIKLAIVNITRKPLVILPSSIGPFKAKASSFIIKILLNRTRSIMVREELSYNNLVEIGVSTTLIKLVPDLAFIMPPSENKAINELIEPIKNPLIGINVSQLINFESKTYADLMAKVADYLSVNLGATILLIPHDIVFREISKVRIATSKGIGGDDIDAVRTVYSRVREKQRIIPITTAYEVDELKKIIGQCDLFIGARTHSIIAALSLSVPTIGIAYSHKTPGIMKSVGLEKYVCDFKVMSFEEVVSKAIDLFSKRDIVKKNLSEQNVNIARNVWGSIDSVVDAIRKT